MNANEFAPITERDIAEFLIQNPGFFERNAELLSAVQLGSAHGQRVVSLHERQAEMLRDKIKVLEHRLVEMIRHGSNNSVTTNRLLKWATGLYLEHDLNALPGKICDDMRDVFMVPQAALRVWGVTPEFAGQPFATGVSADARNFASSLSAPYCGMHVGVEAVKWLDEPTQAASLALLPLRPAGQPRAPAFGMLVLASPDTQRYQEDMATDFLERIAEIASAALSRLTTPGASCAQAASLGAETAAPASAAHEASPSAAPQVAEPGAAYGSAPAAGAAAPQPDGAAAASDSSVSPVQLAAQQESPAQEQGVSGTPSGAGWVAGASSASAGPVASEGSSIRLVVDNSGPSF